MTKSPAPSDEQQPRFPQRDDQGRVVSLLEFVAFTLMVLFVGGLMLAAIDGIFWVLGFGEFGQVSGWIAGVLAVFVFVDDFRAWKDSRFRWIVALVAMLLGMIAGIGVLTLLPTWWWPLLTGVLGATIAALIYDVLWFTGVRLLEGTS